MPTINVIKHLCIAFQIGVLVSLATTATAMPLENHPPPPPAAEITPSHVFQVTQQTINELVLILRFKKIQVREAPDKIRGRSPRHAWQKNREVLIKLGRLQEQEGIEPLILPLEYIGDVQPQQVKALADTALRTVQDLKKHYGISNAAKSVKLRQGKTPTDVFQNLLLISAMLDGLLGNSITPSDVHRVAVSINDVLNHIYLVKGKHPPNIAIETIKGKRPRDVYALALDVMKQVAHLAQKPDFTIRGGITLPNRKGGRITPTDVINVTEIILADIQAISHTAGVSGTIKMAPYMSGKTPSNVYMRLSETLTLLEGLQ